MNDFTRIMMEDDSSSSLAPSRGVRPVPSPLILDGCHECPDKETVEKVFKYALKFDYIADMIVSCCVLPTKQIPSY